jgi:two-component system response regulator
MDYLQHRAKFTDLEEYPMPRFILLDLNMPRKDGREVLVEMKQDPNLRRIPIVVYTTSSEEADIVYSYELGASSYITKPATFDGLVELMRNLGEYWLRVVRLPEIPALA